MEALRERLCVLGAVGERKHTGNQHTHGFSWMWDTNGAGNGSVVVGLLRMAQLILEMLMGLWYYLY